MDAIWTQLMPGAVGVALRARSRTGQQVSVRVGVVTLKSRGVEFMQEPTEQPYGIDAGFRDPSGNHIRMSQPKQSEPAWRRGDDSGSGSSRSGNAPEDEG